MTFAGVALGLLLALAIGRASSNMLYQVSPADPGAFTLAPAALIATALLACWVPARRAANVHPMTALRYE
jgi:ABC-type lipoprotein release transport system permease subunit